MASEDAILMGSFRDPNARSVEPATFDSSIDEVQAEESLDDLRSRYDELLESSPAVEAEPEESESGFTNQLLGSLERTLVADNPRLSGRAIEGLGRVTGIESMQEFGEKIVREFDQSDNPDEFVPTVSTYKDVDGLQSFLDYAGSTLGQGLGSLGVVVGGGAAGAAAGSVIPAAGTAAGAVVGATGSGFLLNYGDTYEYLVEQEGMDPNDAAPYALIPAAGMAVLDTAGVGLVLKPAKDALKKNLVKRTAQLALRGAGSESLTETAQQVIQESAGEMAEALGLAKNDIVASQRFENTANAFLGSLLPGAVFGAASAPLQRPVDKPDDTPPSKPDEFGIPPFSPNEEFLTDENIDQIKKIVRPGYAYFTNSVGSLNQATRAEKLGGVNVIGQGIAESGLLFNERNKGLRIRPFMHPLGAMEDADGTSVAEQLKKAVERGNYLRNAPLTFVYELPIGDVPFQSKVIDGTTIYDGRDDVILNAAKALGLPGTELATAAADSIKEKKGVSRGRDLNRVMPPEFIKGVFVNGQLMTLDDYKASLGLDVDKGSAVEVSAAVAQSEENAPEAAPLPVVESEPVRVTAALTGVQDARDDMKKLKNQFLEESRAIVEAEKRGDNVEPLRKAVKTIENKIFADFEAGLRSLLERDGDIEIVSFERGLGGWAGQKLEPNLRIEVSGDKDTVLSRITEFNQTSGMSGPDAVPQGGALNRILVETIQDKPDVIDLYDAANIEENKKLVWDDNGAERLATLQIDLPAEMLTPESLASLGDIFAEDQLGFTVDRKNNRIELIHTPEWSRSNAQDTLTAFVDAARHLRGIANQNYGSEVSFRWIKEEIQISAPESDVINIKNSFSDGDSAYRVVGYTELRKNVQDDYRGEDSGTVRDRSDSEGQEAGPDAGDSGRPDAGESGVNVEALDDATRGAAAANRSLSKLSTYGKFVLRGIGREESIGLDRLHAGAEQKGLKVDADASRALMARMGLEFSDSDTSAGLKIYPLQDKFGTTLEEVIDRLNKWTKSKGTVAEGWTFSVFGPKRNEDGTLGDFVPPDFKNNSYDQKNAYIYQPYDPNGSFDDVAYTYAWRATHEIAHGIVNDKLTEQYGGQGRRAGGLGILSRDDSGKNIVDPLSLAHALRALDWEHETFVKQREILEQDFGITITDEQFNQEYMLNMSDAVHRVLTGRFSNPGKLGAVPVSTDPAVVLERAKQTVRDAAEAMGLDMAESLGDAATVPSKGVTVYHGSAAEDITAFDVSRAGEKEGGLLPGISFSKNPSTAEYYRPKDPVLKPEYREEYEGLLRDEKRLKEQLLAKINADHGTSHTEYVGFLEDAEGNYIDTRKYPEEQELDRVTKTILQVLDDADSEFPKFHTLVPSGKLYEVKVDLQEPFVFDAKGAAWSLDMDKKILAQMREVGGMDQFDGVIIKDVYDGKAGDIDDIYVVFDTDRIDLPKPPADAFTPTLTSSGQNLVVFHATRKEFDISDFKPSKRGRIGSGIYLTTEKKILDKHSKGTGGNVIPLNVEMKSPLYLSDKLTPEVESVWSSAIDDAGASGSDFFNNLRKKYPSRELKLKDVYESSGARGKKRSLIPKADENFAQSLAQSIGHDSVVLHKDPFLDGRVTEAVVFDSRQLRSSLESSADAATPVADPDPFLENRIEEAAEAGSKTKKEAREAARLWKEKGTESKYFKRWFGKSFLVDSKGKPVRLFHGTDNVFDVFAEPEGPGLFGQGIYATFLPYVADEYTSQLSKLDKDPSLQPNIIPGYVSIQNPIFIKEPADPALIEEAKKVADSFSRKLYLPKGDLTTFDDLLLALDDVTPDRRRYVAAQRKLRLKMVKLGYDGMINASKASFEKAQQIDFKNTTIFDDIPRDMHIILMDSSQFKSDIGNLGTFDPLDPRIQYGLTGAAIPAAAALQQSDEDEGEGNPVAEDFEGPFIYNETRDYSGVSEMVNTMRDAQARYEDLLSEINIIEAEYSSLTQEDRDGDRGRLLSEWHDKTLDEYSSVGDFIDESAYTRFLMGSDVYFDTQPTDIRGFDERRGFRQVGLTDEPMTMDISTRRKQENEQRFKLQKTMENGGPYVDFFGKLGDLNKYLYKKASFFGEPVQTVQLNGHEKRMLYSDEVNLKRLYDSGLVSYLLYRELVGDVELL